MVIDEPAQVVLGTFIEKYRWLIFQQLGPSMEGEMVIHSNAEISGRSWLSIWIDVITHPREKTFQKLLGEKNRTIARSFSWLLFTIIGSRLVILGYAYLREQKFDPSYYQYLVTITLISLLFIVLQTFLLHILSLKFRGEGSLKDIILEFYVQDLLSPGAKGSASFKDLLFIYAAYQAPLNILNGFITVIPSGDCVSFLVSVYAFVLSVLALKSLYGIATTNAGIVVIISSLIVGIPSTVLSLSLFRNLVEI